MQRAVLGSLAIALSACFVGCEPPTRSRTLTLPRAVFAAGHLPGDSERLASSPMRFVFEVPEGWEERPPQEFRQVNLRLKPAQPELPPPHVECYLTRLPNTAAGLTANVNRWRRQMGEEPVDDAAVMAYPRTPLLGGQAIQVDLSGGYTDGHGHHPGYTLLGYVLPWGRDAIFVKAVGPTDLIDRERPQIQAFMQSLRVQP
ncbi:MAG: hypothetical protein KDD82_06075 [Planctomycetes bacterium]|nr:hypothetical protein [Planctomycetota bacterium]